MATTLYPVQDDQTQVGGFLSSQTSAAPIFVPNFFIGCSVIGYNATITSPVVLALQSGGNAYFSAYKNCTVYNMTFTVASTGAAAQNVSFQPYGNATGGAGGFLGTAYLATVPATGPDVAYAQTQSISLSTGGYVGVAVSPAGAGGSYRINALLWIKQLGA